jgi:nitrogen regulatory protein PII
MADHNRLLTIIVSPDIEDIVVDWLLARGDVPGFSTIPIRGHGEQPEAMDLREQVAGRRARVMIQSCLSFETAERVVEALRAEFPGTGIRYWLVPLERFGRLD